MALLNFESVDYSVGGPLLLDKVSFGIEPGERIAVVGRNGAGKSTLLALMQGTIVPDDGRVLRRDGLSVASLPQEVPQGLVGTVFDVVAGGLADLGALLAEYHHLTHAEHFDGDRMGTVQTELDARGGWAVEQRVEQAITQLDLDADATFESLSGGMKRRVMLARALVQQPELLLLDEPTNHLDLGSIAWLEELLLGFAGALVFITHDRRFLRQLATRIIEIDRGQLTSWPGDWANYLRRREERLHAEAQANAHFDRKLAQEEVWIRQGIKARRTRNEGRVRALEAMRRERAKRRELTGKVSLRVEEAERSGRKVIDADGISFAWGGKPIATDFSTTIMRGDRIGIIGPNGSGKTTLVKLLLGELQPDAGELRLGSGLEVAYFDQYRAGLREDWSALDNVAEGREFIEIAGARKHVLGYLQDFLFTPERARAPITKFSGGERNRLLLARLFAKPFNLLVMDEPTNDLDVETLELLEELLGEYQGTLILISHDREFLDNVVTSTLVMEGDGRIGDFVGGYSDWERQRSLPRREPVASSRPAAATVAPPVVATKPKLSYKDQRELELLPAQIEALEKRIAELGTRMADSSFFQQDSQTIVEANQLLAGVQNELERAYARWEALEAQK